MRRRNKGRLRGLIRPAAGLAALAVSARSVPASFTVPVARSVGVEGFAQGPVATRFASRGEVRRARLKARHGAGRPVLAVLAAVVLRAAAKEAEIDEEETLMSESSCLQFDRQRAEGIVEAVREAKQQQLMASEVLRERELISDEASTVQALRALRLAGLHEEVLSLFLDRDFSMADAYVEQMASLEAMGLFQDVFQVLSDMRTKGVAPNVACYNRIFKIHAGNRSTTASLKLLKKMREEKLQPDVHTYDYALGACNSRKKWENIIMLLDAMKADGITPNASVYQTAMHGLSYSEHHARCYEMYIEMRENGISPEGSHLRELLRALFGEEGQRDLNKAMEVFQSLVDDTSVKLSAVHFDIAISVCEKVGRWREILALATAMGGRGITPHSVTCNAVLKACVQLGKWDIALKLLGTMERDGTQLDRIAYLTVLEACGRARQWDEVLKLYAEIEERFPDFIGSDMMLPAIAAMREVGREEEAISLYRQGFGAFLARQQSRRRGSDFMELDARGLSPQVAGVMMRCALEDSAKSADATAARAAKPLALAGFPPTGLKDVVILVNAADLEDEEPLPQTTAEALLKVAREMLGEDAELECQQTPSPSVRVPGRSLQSMLVQQIQQAVSDLQSSPQSM